MNIEELKNQWATHNAQLTKRLEVNENIIIKMSFDKVDEELKKMSNYEIITITTCLITFYFVIHWMNILKVTTETITLGTASIVLTSIIGMISLWKLKNFKSINKYGNPVITFQRKTTKLNLILIRMKRYEYLLNFLLILTTTPLILNVYGGLDIENYNINTYLIYIAVGFVLIIFIDLVLFKIIYAKRIEQIEKQLEVIKTFEAITQTKEFTDI